MSNDKKTQAGSSQKMTRSAELAAYNSNIDMKIYKL